MGYIKDMYGSRNNDFIEGFIAAIDTYAVWSNGKRYIGSPEKEATTVITEAINELGGNSEDFL